MGQVNQDERAKIAWDMLVSLAEKGKTTTYGELAEKFHTDPRACRFFLEKIQAYCKSKGYPFLNSLVIGRDNQKPGKGFIGTDKPLDKTHAEVCAFSWRRLENPFRDETGIKALVNRQKDNFKNWMRLAKKEDALSYSTNTMSEYRSYINLMPDFITRATEDTVQDLFSMDSKSEAVTFFNKFQKDYEPLLKKRDLKKVNNFKAAFMLYIQFLEETSPDALSSFDEVLDNPKVGDSEKEQMMKVRVGQGQFRQELIRIWKGCSVTGYEDYSLLIASHIKPWRACVQSRLDPYNGLLLMPNLDKAFDRGLITFDENGKIIISKHLKNPHALGISQDMNVKLKPSNKPYMDFHRQFKLFMNTVQQ